MLGTHECKIIADDQILPYMDMIAEFLDMVPDTVITNATNHFGEDPIYWTDTMRRMINCAPTTTFTF